MFSLTNTTCSGKPIQARWAFRGIFVYSIWVVSFCSIINLLNSTDVLADTHDPAIHELIEGLHRDARQAEFEQYFARYTAHATFLGTDATERWSLEEFKTYSQPIFEAGDGWDYRVVERNLYGEGDIRWFDEILHNQGLGLCRGTGVVIFDGSRWLITHYALSMLIPNAIAYDVGAMGESTLAIESAGGSYDPSE
jgi:hypothetical protein